MRRIGRHADSALPSGDDDGTEIHRAKRRVHQRVAHHNRAGRGQQRAERAGGWLRGGTVAPAAKAGQGAHAEQRAHRAHPPQPDGNELDELHGAGAAGVPSAGAAGAVHHAHLRYADRAANHPRRHFPGGFARVGAAGTSGARRGKRLLSGRNAGCGGGRHPRRSCPRRRRAPARWWASASRSNAAPAWICRCPCARRCTQIRRPQSSGTRHARRWPGKRCRRCMYGSSALLRGT